VSGAFRAYGDRALAESPRESLGETLLVRMAPGRADEASDLSVRHQPRRQRSEMGRPIRVFSGRWRRLHLDAAQGLRAQAAGTSAIHTVSCCGRRGRAGPGLCDAGRPRALRGRQERFPLANVRATTVPRTTPRRVRAAHATGPVRSSPADGGEPP